MGTYDTRAKGIWVDGNDEITAAELADYDFLIAKVGDKFHANVQNAYDADIPLIMFYQFRPEIWLGSVLSETAWPADQNLCLTECRQWIMSGGTKRAIHGVMIDCSEPMPQNQTDAVWLTRPAKKFIGDLYAEFRLPNYLYLNRNPINLFGKTQTGKDTLFGFVASQDGMSTNTFVSVTSAGLPIDTAKPMTDYNNTKTWFWLYRIFGKRILSLYLQGTKQALYADLGFVSNSSNPEIPVPPVVPGTTNLTVVNAKLDAIYNYLTTHIK
jgi:hypothetical protein